MPGLLTSGQYKSLLMNAGFKDIDFNDITDKVMPSLDRLKKLTAIFYPVAKFLNKIRIINNDRLGNIEASLAQIKSLHKGLWRYIIVTANKH